MSRVEVDAYKGEGTERLTVKPAVDTTKAGRNEYGVYDSRLPAW